MYKKVRHTSHPPAENPLLGWDGDCGFCKYWVLRWQMMTGDRINYEPYQSAAEEFPDIPEERFREAAQLIEPDGRVFSGAAAAYRTFTYDTPWAFLSDWYQTVTPFQRLSDLAYQWIADHRPLMFRLTKALFGKNPRSPKNYWLYYLLGLLLLILLMLS
jgi:predicted DCC family thiol-disulfide oxidoreductase YuxK